MEYGKSSISVIWRCGYLDFLINTGKIVLYFNTMGMTIIPKISYDDTVEYIGNEEKMLIYRDKVVFNDMKTRFKGLEIYFGTGVDLIDILLNKIHYSSYNSFRFDGESFITESSMILSVGDDDRFFDFTIRGGIVNEFIGKHLPIKGNYIAIETAIETGDGYNTLFAHFGQSAPRSLKISIDLSNEELDEIFPIIPQKIVYINIGGSSVKSAY
jgi:hypothetical protein